MSWQDLVFTIGQFIFVIALIPSIKGNDKPAFLTSLMTAIILTFFALSYATLELWGSMIGAIANTTGWSILAIQKYQMDQNK
ncbi:hypothetical protein HYS97_02715 [Candidatus Daviesbacteria bacterium]|nr:hypothetical protein [Candidatus Daviesbacteria bacterium]